MTPTLTTTIVAQSSTNVSNASTSITNGFASSTGMSGFVLGLTLAALALVLASWFVTSLYQRYAWARWAVEHVVTSFEYAVKGVGTVALLAVVAVPIYLVATADGETQGRIGMAVAAVVVAYVGLAALGYAADRVYQRLKSRHERVRERYESEYDDRWTAESDDA